MKAFLLAAGHGTRLRPITDTLPKCLVPIRGVPLLQLWLRQCSRYGIDEVLINIHTQRDAVEQFLRSSNSSVKVQLQEERELLGSAGTLRANRDWIGADPLFWVFYADVLNATRLDEMQRFHQQRNVQATIGVYQVPDPQRCGIVLADEDGIVREFEEKPQHPKGDLAFSGLMLARSEVLDSIPDLHPVDIGFHLLPRLVGKMAAYPITDYLIDVGTMPNYEYAQRTWPGLQD